WPRENNDRIELVADKTLYEPGDTARVLVPSPFAGPVQALLTIERAGVVSAELITLAGNSETLQIPIREEHIPNIFVSIAIAKGIDETNPTPAMRIGYVQLTVDTSAKELTIAAASSAASVEPGASVAYTLTVSDSAGEPVAGAEVSVAIVDRAVLALAPEPDRSLVDIFYYQRPLGVSTSALLTINRDRMSQQLSEGAKGGGGGDGMGIEVRSEFPDIAFWRADLLSDAAGQITFTVDLPDNLTTWRLIAKAVTDDTRVGDARLDVVAAKELQLRPLAPRFFTAGDRAHIGASLVNATALDLSDGLITLELEGAEIEDAADTSVQFELPSAGQQLQTWPIVVPETSSRVVLTLTAVADTVEADARTLADAVRLELPVRRYESPETVATSGAVPPSGVLEVIQLPEEATDNGSLQIGVEPSLAGGLIEGLDYLRAYPYECNEQVVSRFLPNLFTVEALHTLGIEDSELEANLDEQVMISVQQLVNRQALDGGWGYWPNQPTSPFITAYVLWGLASADALGYTVPARTLQNAVAYLERSFIAPKDVQYRWQLNEMAFMHFVLAEMDQGDPGRASTLYDVRERLGIYGRAYLAMALAAMSEAGAEDPRVAALLDDLYSAAKVTATTAWWQEPEVDFRNLNTDTRTTSIVLEAFIRLDPQNPLLPQVVRWLMETREGGRWSTTQENAWAIIALSRWLQETGELNADYTWSVTLNDEELASDAVTPETVDEKATLQVAVADLLRHEANTLRFHRDGAQGRMYYTTRLRYYLDAATVEARDRGIVVDRRFVRANAGAGSRPSSGINSGINEDGEEITVEEAAVGDVISVTVTLIAPTDLHHLLVEVPIPAGTEPIDPSLLTTSDQVVGPVMEMEATESGKPAWQHYWTPTYSDLRDDRVALFATFLTAGTYEYTFAVQATLPGEFRVLPVYAEQMYFNEVWGRSSGQLFTVRE
ncbi:MAG TPA: alpha-2-macroglobulin family protein, partial [Caldilineaceae bacterium]|nr:alpha-2-macroglobulin family protein [Caldilineaceae bacterium]